VPSFPTPRHVRIRASRRLVALSKLAQLTSALAMLSLTSIRVGADTPARPAIAFNRWSEDWSVLADHDVPCERPHCRFYGWSRHQLLGCRSTIWLVTHQSLQKSKAHGCQTRTGASVPRAPHEDRPRAQQTQPERETGGLRRNAGPRRGARRWLGLVVAAASNALRASSISGRCFRAQSAIATNGSRRVRPSLVSS
jgi:hypothetical protein